MAFRKDLPASPAEEREREREGEKVKMAYLRSSSNACNRYLGMQVLHLQDNCETLDVHFYT